MKLFSPKYIFICLTLCLIANMTHAQIGIGTDDPQGILDLNGDGSSTNQGLVFPRVALLQSNWRAPVTNPNGGLIVPGTTVFNTATTSNGTNDVYPGIYSWNGSLWAPQFILEQYSKYEQVGGCFRTEIREGTSDPDATNVDIIELEGNETNTFVPVYTGTYKIEVKTNFGAGKMLDITGGVDAISLATSEGAFFFSCSGTGVSIDPTSALYDYAQGWSYTHSYSTHNTIESPTLEDNTIPHYASLVYYRQLTAGHMYTFSLTNNINTGDTYFENNGDPNGDGSANDGQGHVGHDIPCSVEFTFLQE